MTEVERAGRMFGTIRFEPWLSLDDEEQLMRRLIARLARETWRCVLVGNQAPHVVAQFQRMTDPQAGDLVVEHGAMHTDDPGRYQGIGYLVGMRYEDGEDVWYVQYGPSPEDVCRWRNAEFIAVDVGMRGGDMTEVEQAGTKVAQTRRQLARDMAALAAVVRTAAEQGVPDTELARQAGVARMTIRKWRLNGKAK